MSLINTPIIPDACNTIEDVEKVLRFEFREHDSWTPKCTEALLKSSKLLFHYDRFEYACGKAFGTDSSNLKIVLNPLMMICYHPSCSKKKKCIIHLKSPLSITDYIKHLGMHTDKVGQSMFKRFFALKNDIFHDKCHYDTVFESPASLLFPGPFIGIDVQNYMKKYGIVRNLDVNYICHWKDRLIKDGSIPSQSLPFQEDDALIELGLSYPQPVKDWSYWKTIAFYGLKLMTSVSATAVSLYRGITRYPGLQYQDQTIASRAQFMKDVNHPSASVSTMRNWFPKVSYDHNQHHVRFQKIHLKMLQKSDDSLALKFPMVCRYLVSLVIDNQELNQGTFSENGVLHGLSKKLDASKLKTIGLENLVSHIMSSCPYISSVREYRLTDLAGIYCSTIYTQYISGELKTQECDDLLTLVCKISRRCELCLQNNTDCKFEFIDKQCEACIERKTECTGLFVIHNLWDMASSHVSAAKTRKKVTVDSSDEEFKDTSLLTIGFGGLHLAKSPTNGTRNHTLTLGGQNYGLNILRSLRMTPGDHSSILDTLRTAVIVGKDRQSDLNSYQSTANVVQETLKLAKVYKCIRIPEPVLSYTDKAKTQRKIIFPTGMQCNKNGDIFIADAGTACIYAIDRFSVSKMHVIGKYRCPSKKPYKGTKMKKGNAMLLSNNISDIHIPDADDVIYVADAGRNELIILRNCSLARSITSSFFNIMKIDHIRSVCTMDGQLICLSEKSSENVVEIMELELPRPRKTSQLELTGKVVKKIKLSERSKFVFPVVPAILGLVSVDNEIIFYSKLKSNSCSKNYTGVKTSVKPQACESSVVYVPVGSKQVNRLNITVKGGVSYSYSGNVQEINESTYFVSVWGSTYYILSNVDGVYKVIEYGNLSFGLKFCEELNAFYRAICYVPPHGYKSGGKLTLRDSIKLAEPFKKTISSMQQECKERFPSWNSFTGLHGAVFSGTVKCIEMTIESWKALVARLDHFDQTLVDKVNPHAVTNEALIEHTFGFIKGKGQGQLLTMYEYIHCKWSHEIDFQLRLCETAFCQHIKTKLRDKSYQDLDKQFHYNMTMEDLWKALFSDRVKTSTEEVVVSDEDKKILLDAFRLTKSVPRRSNRAKWKEQSGFAPNLLIPHQDEHKVFTGDLVFCKDLSHSIRKLIVAKGKTLRNNNEKILVKDVENGSKLHVLTSSLVTDKGMLIVIPKSQYKIEGSSIVFSDLALDTWEMCSNAVDLSSNYTDEELAGLEVDPDRFMMDNSSDTGDSSDNLTSDDDCSGSSSSNSFENEIVNEERTVSEYEEDDEVRHKRGKRKRKMVESDDECGDDEQSVMEINIGDWVVSAFVFTGNKRKINFYVGQVLSKDVKQAEEDHRIQFYRSQIPHEHVYIKLPSAEYAPQNSIVEKIDKPEVLSGGRIKLLMLPKEKLV